MSNKVRKRVCTKNIANQHAPFRKTTVILISQVPDSNGMTNLITEQIPHSLTSSVTKTKDLLANLFNDSSLKI